SNAVNLRLGRFRNQRRKIFLAKMPFRFRFGIKGLGRFLLLRGERDHFARFFLPLLDQREIAHDFDLPLKISEAQAPAETLFVKTAKLGLVTMMISWSQQSSGCPFARNTVEIALDRIVQGHIGGVEAWRGAGKKSRERFRSLRSSGLRSSRSPRSCRRRVFSASRR